ncbi:hypothetical protein EDD85DRAFT_795140 [Armillaria nabsnona]|nr:hypothetical protein EDD85DRAFT_795140 [Armillaria nabsnona]
MESPARLHHPAPYGNVPIIWIKWISKQRHASLPQIFLAPKHSLVPTPSIGSVGLIWVTVVNFRGDTLEHAMLYIAKLKSFCDLEVAGELRMPALRPRQNDFFLMRKMGHNFDKTADHLISWAINPDFISISETNILARHLQPWRPLLTVCTEGGAYEGGIAVERDSMSNFHVANASLSYHLTTSIQPRTMVEVPHKSNKDDGRSECIDNSAMRRDLVETGFLAAHAGLVKGGIERMEEMRIQSEVVNYPHVGNDRNIYWPAVQLNVADAVDVGSDATLQSALGEFGGAHIDVGDHPVMPTAMINLLQAHPDVEPECFCLLEFGVVWILEPFGTIYFSGLHLHGGGQPWYRPDHLHVDCACKSHDLRTKNWCKQATYTVDSGTIMPPTVHFNHFFDKDKLTDAFSVVIDGKRIGAKCWESGPGWVGDNTHIGKEYEVNLTAMPEWQLSKWHNDDDQSVHPYGNTTLSSATERWKKLAQTRAAARPIAALTQAAYPSSQVGGRPVDRKRVFNKLRDMNDNEGVSNKHRQMVMSRNITTQATKNIHDVLLIICSETESMEVETEHEMNMHKEVHWINVNDLDKLHHFLSMTYLSFQLKTYMAEYITSQPAASKIDLPPPTSLVHAELACLYLSACSQETVHIILHLLCTQPGLSTREGKSARQMAIDRQRYMFSNVILWDWLELTVERAMYTYTASQYGLQAFNEPHWLCLLVQRIYEALQSGISVMLCADDFSTAFNGQQKWTLLVEHPLSTGIERLKMECEDCLRTWFGWPSECS